MNNVVVANNAVTVNLNVREDLFSVVLHGIVLTGVTLLPSAVAGGWLSQTYLSEQTVDLHNEVAIAGLITSLALIPFILYLAKKRSTACVTTGIAIGGFAIGGLLGLL
jgi:hypothetical protein